MIVASSAAELDALLDALTGARRIALDVEGNGLYAYRAALCVLQLAWPAEEGAVEIGIIDPFAVDIRPLAGILGETGPIKVLHDLTFDARLLFESGIRLGNVHDTSVMAQLLGEQKSGLASLVESHFGVHVSKGLQDHDWAKRPFSDEELAYLAQDVRFLLDLDDALARAVRDKGIDAEVDAECHYKLATAFEPPRDQRAPHARVKGYSSLGARSKAVLKRLCEARELIAEEQDVPPFRIAPNGMLLAMAEKRPDDEASVQRLCRRHRAARYADDWLTAIAKGEKDAPEPKEASPLGESLSAAEQARLKMLKAKLTEWRKKEAAERQVTLQVVVPGHCMSEVAAALAARPNDPDALLDELSAIAGLGDARIDRYLGTWAELAAR